MLKKALFKRQTQLSVFTASLIITVVFIISYEFNSNSSECISNEVEQNEASIFKSSTKLIENAPFIFIGGSQRSGTTLMRALLDVHDSVSCGTEPGFLNDFLDITSEVGTARRFRRRGFTTDMFNNAARLYISSILTEHSRRKADRACAKDPLMALQMSYLSSLFPKAKFIYMVRDPRPHALSSLKYYNKSADTENLKWVIYQWNIFNIIVNAQCEKIGPEKCLLVHYENLILNFNRTMSRVVEFLNITWTNDFLHHETFIGTKIRVADNEWSTPQIKKPVYADALTSWTRVSNFGEFNVESYANISGKLGYDLKVNDYSYFIEKKKD
jgi:protein-tyrosine sulfotransferase